MCLLLSCVDDKCGIRPTVGSRLVKYRHKTIATLVQFAKVIRAEFHPLVGFGRVRGGFLLDQSLV